MRYIKGSKEGAIIIIIAPDIELDKCEFDTSYRWDKPKYITDQHAWKVCDYFGAPYLSHKIVVIFQHITEDGLLITKYKII